MSVTLTDLTPAAGSITASHLADSAVDLSTAKVVGLLPGAKIADGAVSPSKASKSALRDPMVINSSEQSVAGITATTIKTAQFAKSASGPGAISDISFAASLKTSNASYAATIELYIDSEATPRSGATLSSSSAAYDLQSTGDIDVSDLSTGVHSLTFKLKSADASATAYNKQLDIYGVRA